MKHLGWIGLGVLLGIFASANARASRQDLASYVESQISMMDEAIASCPAEAGATVEDWYLRRFWLRLRPKAGFSVPGAKIEIVPEVELLWERAYPDGWVTYKPASL